MVFILSSHLYFLEDCFYFAKDFMCIIKLYKCVYSHACVHVCVYVDSVTSFLLELCSIFPISLRMLCFYFHSIQPIFKYLS